MELIEKYNQALQDIYDHVGFKEDWVVCPIDDCTEMYWMILGNTPHTQQVAFHEEKQNVKELNGNHYQDDIYTQRFYEKWIYPGKDFTMIFCNPGVDGMKWFRLFDNSKRLYEEGDTKENTYDEDGILQNMDVWDWIVTVQGDVRQITHHDMSDLKGEDIARFATREEIEKQKNGE